MNTTLVSLLLFDGGLHLFLAPAHLSESPVLGASFLLCGLLQCLLAGLVLRHTPPWTLGLSVAVSAVALGAYVLAVTIGLPPLPGPTPMHSSMPMPGLTAREAVTPLGLISKLVEVATIVSAMRASHGLRWADLLRPATRAL